MANPYRGHSRHPSTSLGSSHVPPHGQHPLIQPVPASSSSIINSHSLANRAGHFASSAHYSHPAPSQFGPSASSQSTYGYYSTRSSLHPTVPSHDHSRSSKGGVTIHSTYSAPATAASSERASKRQKGSALSPQGAYSDLRHPASRSHSYESPVSSGYSSPGYAYPHDPYGPQLFQPPSIPEVRTSTGRDAHHYGGTHSHSASSEYEEQEEERLDHGPTELPPRTYSGKSKYDSPRKPGKIPGSAMEFLPILEARFDRLETAIDRYVDYRSQRALSNSILPGMDVPKSSSYSYPQRK